MNLLAPMLPFDAIAAAPADWSPPELRHYQQSALDMVRREVAAGRRRIVLQLPTGAGKTVIAGEMMLGALRKGSRALFTVPALSLVDQTVEKFWHHNVRAVGVMQAQHPMTDATQPIQLATVQTLRNRKIDAPRLAVVDEGHIGDKALDKRLASPEWADVIVVVLSATPWARGMGTKFETLLVPVTMKQLIAEGWLTPYRAFGPSQPDLSKVRTSKGDYNEDELADVMSDAKLVADAVQSWIEHGQGRPTLCFGVNRTHADKLCQAFNAAGISAEYCDAFTPTDEREAIGQRLRRGETMVCCNVSTLTTGIDWPWISCISLNRPTKSEMLFVQIVGRGLRPIWADWCDPAACDDADRVRAILDGPKPDCIILDHSSACERLGFPDEIHHDELDDGKSRKHQETREKREKPRRCPNPSCNYLRPPSAHKCPRCGFEPERQSKIQCERGELVELKGKQKAKAASRETKENWYAMLLWVARDRHYKDGWVYHAFKNKFGIAPRNMSHLTAPPSVEVKGWIKHYQIKRAYSRKKTRSAA